MAEQKQESGILEEAVPSSAAHQAADAPEGSQAAAPVDAALDEGPSEELEAIHRRNAWIRAADKALSDVRQRSYEGKLTTSSRWKKQAMQPEGEDARAFEQELLSYIEAREHAEAKPVVGRVSAPKPLDVQMRGQDVDEDSPLPDLDVRDIAILRGKKGVYLYSVALLSHSFAKALFLTQEDNDVATFVDVVRTESGTYPRPVGIGSFMNPPYLWTPTKTSGVYDEVVRSESFKDIHMVKTSLGVPYYYSDLYLSEAQAKALAQWYGVERTANP